jgi:collagen type I alpha
MFTAIRKRFTFANVALTLALVFAMTGGAYAAKKYLITSTKQISPKVLSALKGKAGPAGSAGAVGAAGAAGPVGPAGPVGAKGETGPTGKEGVKGTTGSTGPQGATGPQGSTGQQGVTGQQGATGATGLAGVIHPGETLPSGASETGAWTLGYTVPSGEPFKRTAVSFPIPLAQGAAAPTTNIIGVEEGEGEPNERKPFPAGCKGSVEKPEAKKGNFCIFVGVSAGVGSLTLEAILSPSGQTAEATGTTGAQLSFGTKEGSAIASGTWAVTAE